MFNWQYNQKFVEKTQKNIGTMKQNRVYIDYIDIDKQ